eukprot:5144899-Pleurochrysis_carterae.AAC.2
MVEPERWVQRVGISLSEEIFSLLPVKPPEVDALPLKRREHVPMERGRVRPVEWIERRVCRMHRQLHRPRKALPRILGVQHAGLQVQVQRSMHAARMASSKKLLRIGKVLRIPAES